jgi:hypothetical protein
MVRIIYKSKIYFILITSLVLISFKVNSTITWQFTTTDPNIIALEQTFLMTFLTKSLTESPSFAALFNEIANSPNNVTIIIGLGQNFIVGGKIIPVVVDYYAGGGVMYLDLLDLSGYPNPVYNSETHSWEYGTAKPWALTIPCLFAHVLSEGYHAAKTGESYENCHKIAIDAENDVRKDMGQEDYPIMGRVWEKDNRSLSTDTGNINNWENEWDYYDNDANLIRISYEP